MIRITNVQISGRNLNGDAFRFSVCQDELQLLSKTPSRIEHGANESWLSVTMFAKEAGVTPQAVRKMISEGRLTSRKVGEQHVILIEELNRYLAER